MKKIWKYIIMFIIANSVKQSACVAQITLDTIVQPWNAIGFDFYTVQISDSETKY